MRTSRPWLIGLALIAALGFGGKALARAMVKRVDFNHDIRPILNRNCVQCHGGIRQQGELSLLFRDDALKPAKSGKRAIVPGNPGASELIARVTNADPHDRMPKGRAPLSAEEIGLLRRWISQGAEWQNHWAYVKPVAAPLPPVSDTAWVRSGLDRFVLARLEREGLTPSREADCATLTRRARPRTPVFRGNAAAPATRRASRRTPSEIGRAHV